ncbi:hypothetical protein RchiOBHm_Chr5g0065231 [Rosa chinensis]|uniref:Uncharacterized protein n=1 Tax=Rosa chinensis TaxID=74649 RepID=A0A2P6QIX4_ROSCH|nr:hypothetical protein RchiOBHm_Chr5g0065231 [Rosa chinensis]
MESGSEQEEDFTRRDCTVWFEMGWPDFFNFIIQVGQYSGAENRKVYQVVDPRSHGNVLTSQRKNN